MLTPAELVWLIAAVAKGDEAAFERLYAATRAKLFGVVLRILRRQDLAEEVIQEAYVKIWNSAGQFNPALASPITWMASIARNRAIDVVRKKARPRSRRSRPPWKWQPTHPIRWRVAR
jgi:RNA polymerase sigma-70 factor (ECF subfamily)